MKGYVYPAKEVVARLKKSYQWIEVDNWKPSLKLNHSEVSNSHWMYSDEFNNYMKSTNFIGAFYLDWNNQFIYFEVER